MQQLGFQTALTGGVANHHLHGQRFDQYPLIGQKDLTPKEHFRNGDKPIVNLDRACLGQRDEMLGNGVVRPLGGIDSKRIDPRRRDLIFRCAKRPVSLSLRGKSGR